MRRPPTPRSLNHKKYDISTSAVINTPIDETTWIAPGTFDISNQGPRATLLFRLRQLRRAIWIGKKVNLDFSNIEKVHADGMLLFLAELRRLIKHTEGELKITCIPPQSDKVCQVFQQIGLFDLLGHSHSAVPKDDDVINWRFAHGRKVEGQRYEDVLAEYDGNIAQPLQENLFAGITEAMTNVLNHAYALPREDETGIVNSREWWMFSQSKDDQLTVAFLDLGAGIPKTLPLKRPALWQKLVRLNRTLDSRTIEYALKDSISRTNESHRGKGLGQMARVVDLVPGGVITILSNFGGLTRKGSGISRRDYSDSIQGTMIFWKIPLPVKESA
jgi:ABC-type transporter Mla MlaB component